MECIGMVLILCTEEEDTELGNITEKHNLKQTKKNKRMKLTNSSGRKNQRRIDVVSRLENQLKSGVKPVHSTKNEFVEFGATDPLSETDISRIKKEIEVLNKRIMSPDLANSIRNKKYRGAGR